MPEPPMAPEKTTPAIADELKKMEAEYEPLLPAEKKLIVYSFGAGVVLLAILVAISKLYF